MKKLYSLNYLLFISSSILGQSITVTGPSGYDACGDFDTTFVVFENPINSELGESAINISLGSGMEYLAGSATITNVTLTDASVGAGISISGNGSNIELIIEETQTSGEIRFYYISRATCVTGAASDTFIFRYEDADAGPGQDPEPSDTTYQNYTVIPPVVQIQSINPATTRAAIGVPFTRTFTIVNSNSNGALVDNFYLTNFGTDNLDFVSVIGGTLNATQDTIFVDETDLASATSTGSIPNRLEDGETYQLQITQVADDCDALTGEMEVGWLCEDIPCGTNRRDQSVLLAEGDPLLEYTFERLNTLNACQDGLVRITIKNTGENITTPEDSVTAIAHDINTRLGRWRWWQAGFQDILPRLPETDYYNLPGNTDPRDETIRIRLYDFEIDGVSVDSLPTSFADRREGTILDLSSLTGPVMGLQDLDGDGIFNDLGVGDSFTIDLRIDIPCLDECPGTDNELTELGGYRLLAYTEVRDIPCEGENDYRDSVFWSYGGSTNRENFDNFIFEDNRDDSPISYFPSNTMNDEDTVTVSICFDRRRDNLFCTKDSIYLIIDSIPGYTIIDDIDACSGVAAGILDINETTVAGRIVMTNPNYFFISPGDTTRRLEDVCFTFDLLLNCDAPGFDENEPIDFEVYYDCAGASCPCIQPIECDRLDITTNCPSGCSEGAQIVSMEVQRNTFGWVADYTTNAAGTQVIDVDYIPVYPPLPDSLACQFRTDRAMPYDSLLVTAQAVVNTANPLGYDNMFFELTHTAGLPLFVDSVRVASITYTNAASGTTSVITLPDNRTDGVVTTGSGVQLEFQAGQDGFPASFGDGDIFDIELELIVAKNDAYLTYVPTSIPDFQGFVYSDVGGTRLSCDTVLNTFELHRPYYGGRDVTNGGFTPGVSGLAPEGAGINWGRGIRFSDCDEYSIEAQLFLNDQEYAKYYPGEFRPWFEVDSLVFETLADRFSYQISSGRYRTWNHDDVEGNNEYDFFQYEDGNTNVPRPDSLSTFPSPTITSLGGNTRFVFDGSNWHLAEITSDNQGERFFFDADIDPISCHHPESDGERVSVEWHLRNYAYSRNPEAANEVHIATDEEEAFIEKQPLSINLPAGDLDEAFTDNESFVFEICNDIANDAQGADNNGRLPASNVWFTFESPSDEIQIRSITRVSDGASMTVDTYGTGQYWVQAGDFAFNECEEYQVFYDYTTCTADSLIVGAAWDCVYPSAPDDTRAQTCNIVEDVLTIDIKSTLIQLSIRQTDSAFICDTVTYLMEVTNTNLQYVRDLSVTFNPPAGTSYVPNSSSILYPVSTTQDPLDPTLYAALADPTGNVWDLSSLGIIPGSIVTDSNKVFIRFDIALSCNYPVGTQPTARVDAVKYCGDPVSDESTPSIPAIRGSGTLIYQANNSVNSGVAIEMNGCGATGLATIRMENAGPSTTRADDSIFVELPAGFSYVAGSYVGILNAQSNGTAPIVSGNTLVWEVPAGITVGNAMEFSIEVRANTDAACGANPMDVYTTTTSGFFCPYDGGSSCDANVITGTRTAFLNHQKPDLDLNIVNLEVDVDSDMLSATGDITNYGQVGTDNNNGHPNTTVRFYCDNNENDTFDAGTDVELATYTTGATMAASGGNHTFNINVPLGGLTCPDSDSDGQAPGIAVIRRFDDSNNLDNCICSDVAARRFIILPVTWLWVDGEARKNANLIQWRVIEEGEVLSYIVEHYQPSSDTWKAVGEVPARGLDGETLLYQLTHPNPSPEELYRVRAVERGSEGSISNVFAVYNQDTRNELKVFPNPASDYVRLMNTGQLTYFEITDQLGRRITSGELAPNEIAELSTSGYRSGQYVVSFRNESEVRHISFIVQR